MTAPASSGLVVRSGLLVALAVVLGAIVGVGPSARKAFACSCAESTLSEFVDQNPEAAVAAFAGRQVSRVVEDEQVDDGAVLTFAVETVYLGDVGTMVEVRTHAQGSACGLDVSGVTPVGILVTDFGRGPSVDLCTSRWPVDELAAEFGPGSEPTNAPSTTLGSSGAADGGSWDSARFGLGALLLAIVATGVALVWRRRRR